MHLRRSHIAILISLIGTGSLCGRSALAQEDATARPDSRERVEASETAIRNALGLANTPGAVLDHVAVRPSGSSRGTAFEHRDSAVSARAPDAVPLWDANAIGLAPSPSHEPSTARRQVAAASPSYDASDEEHVRWTLAILPPTVAQPPAVRVASPAHPTPRPPAVGAISPSPSPSNAAGDEPPPLDGPSLQEHAPADRAEPAAFVSPLPEAQVADTAASLLATVTNPRPRRRNGHPRDVIADTPSTHRRGSFWTSTTLALPPDHANARTRASATGGAKAHRLTHARPLLAAGNGEGDAAKDTLVSLLQVLDDRDATAAPRAPEALALLADVNGARIAGDVFDRIALEAGRLAEAVTTARAAEEPGAVATRDIVDTIAASEASSSDPFAMLPDGRQTSDAERPGAFASLAARQSSMPGGSAAAPASTEARTSAISPAPLVEATTVADERADGRYLPMHLLEIVGDEVIDPAGALPVQALLVTPSHRAPDPLPPPLLPLSFAVNADVSPEPAAIAALRSFIDERSAMRTARVTPAASDGRRRPSTMVEGVEAATRAIEVESLDFPPLFDEAPRAAMLQVDIAPATPVTHGGELLSFVPPRDPAPTREPSATPRIAKVATAPSNEPTATEDVPPLHFDPIAQNPALDTDLRPSITFDIFDPHLALSPPTTPDRREAGIAADGPRPVASVASVASVSPATESAPVEFEIKSIVRGRRDSSKSGNEDSRPNPLQGTLVALADSKLEEMRGGFETDSGLRISFGIERAVYVNGALVTTTSLNVADLSHLTAGQAQSMGLDRATLGIIQSGTNNTFTQNQVSSANVATVVQNTLNDQKIQGITQINATVNSLDMIRRTDVQSSIQSALTNSIRR